ncbi:MAG: thioredoxin fold domain-containing protein [Bacteroidota bacterium]
MKVFNHYSTLFLALSILLLCTSFAPIEEKADAKIEWITLEELQTKMESEPRKVLIDSYASWCGWCKVMDKTTFSEKKVVEYVNENYYAVKLDTESEELINFKGKEMTKQELAIKFGIRDLPTFLLMDDELIIKEVVRGYKKSKPFLKILSKFNS